MKHILIVDDNKTNLTIAKNELSKEYQVTPVLSGMQALKVLEKKKVDLILLDVKMPEMDGKETIQKIQKREEWKNIPVIFLTADSAPETEVECLELGADDFLIKPFTPRVMKQRVAHVLELHDLREDLETQLKKKTNQVERVTLNSIMAISNTIDARDKYTCGHSIRVAKCAQEIARQLNWSEEELQNIHYIALLHDIGKIGVPDSILNKPSRLSDNEFNIIKKHPAIGGDILKDIKLIRNVAEGALYHHERWDGKGYPFGLRGESIPYTARIIGIADAYDAMTSNRVYRHKLSDDEVLEEFEKGCGTQFDPKLCAIFVDMLKKGFRICEISEWDEEDIADESGMLLNKVLNEYTSDIKENAMKDSLTGLYNRVYAEDKVEELLRNGVTGALFMIDMDNFKHINDTYGHIAGDVTLRMFADTLRACTGEEDVLCRIGGDEFVVFFVNENKKMVLAKKAEGILGMLQLKLKELQYDDVTSVSIGIATYPQDGNNFISLYKNADKALYYVKRNGKNSYHFFCDEELLEKQEDTRIDLANVRQMIEGSADMESGALSIEYNNFQQISHYICRYVYRNHKEVQTLLFTCQGNGTSYPDTEMMEEAMQVLENAVRSSLRSVDVGTKYSSSQYILILMDTNLENGKKVAERVLEKFYRIYQGEGISLNYDIQTMQPQKKDEKRE